MTNDFLPVTDPKQLHSVFIKNLGQSDISDYICGKKRTKTLFTLFVLKQNKY